jgi:hypothetical protein
MTVKKNKAPNYYRPNFWGMIRDIFVTSMNKGQFPVMVVGIIIIILVIKLPSNEAYNLLHEILLLFEKWHILGWILSLLFLVGWLFNVRRIRKIHSSEMDRVSNNKRDLQGKLVNKNLPTSKNK